MADVSNINVNGQLYEINDATARGMLANMQSEIDGSNVAVDAALSSTSENPVQNKAVYAAIIDIQNDVTTAVVGLEGYQSIADTYIDGTSIKNEGTHTNLTYDGTSSYSLTMENGTGTVGAYDDFAVSGKYFYVELRSSQFSEANLTWQVSLIDAYNSTYGQYDIKSYVDGDTATLSGEIPDNCVTLRIYVYANQWYTSSVNFVIDKLQIMPYVYSDNGDNCVRMSSVLTAGGAVDLVTKINQEYAKGYRKFVLDAGTYYVQSSIYMQTAERIQICGSKTGSTVIKSVDGSFADTIISSLYSTGVNVDIEDCEIYNATYYSSGHVSLKNCRLVYTVGYSTDVQAGFGVCTAAGVYDETDVALEGVEIVNNTGAELYYCVHNAFINGAVFKDVSIGEGFTYPIQNAGGAKNSVFDGVKIASGFTGILSLGNKNYGYERNTIRNCTIQNIDEECISFDADGNTVSLIPKLAEIAIISIGSVTVGEMGCWKLYVKAWNVEGDTERTAIDLDDGYARGYLQFGAGNGGSEAGNICKIIESGKDSGGNYVVIFTANAITGITLYDESATYSDEAFMRNTAAIVLPAIFNTIEDNLLVNGKQNTIVLYNCVNCNTVINNKSVNCAGGIVLQGGTYVGTPFYCNGNKVIGNTDNNLHVSGRSGWGDLVDISKNVVMGNVFASATIDNSKQMALHGNTVGTWAITDSTAYAYVIDSGVLVNTLVNIGG